MCGTTAFDAIGYAVVLFFALETKMKKVILQMRDDFTW